MSRKRHHKQLISVILNRNAILQPLTTNLSSSRLFFSHFWGKLGNYHQGLILEVHAMQGKLYLHVDIDLKIKNFPTPVILEVHGS